MSTMKNIIAGFFVILLFVLLVGGLFFLCVHFFNSEICGVIGTLIVVLGLYQIYIKHYESL